MTTSGSSLYDSKHMWLATETEGHYLGSMPPLKFIERFFPAASSATLPVKRNAFAEIVTTSMNEEDMYGPFIEAATPFAPTLKFIDTHFTGDVDCGDLATDVSAYKVEDLPAKPDQTDFSKMELFAEFKFDIDADPFIDADPDYPVKPSSFERDTNKAWALRGQMASYVSALTGSQFRVHVFTILICGKSARLMCWDRNGAIVTRAFDYTRIDYLGLFLKHYNSAVDRHGHDSTVGIATKALVNLKGVPTPDLTDLKDSNDRHQEFRIMMIPDRDDASKELKFLISYPLKYTSRSPFGRGTRPMKAYDLRQSRLVFVKDYWRPVGSDKEGEIYRILAEKKVPHIAPFGTGNDVRNWTTVTDQLRKEEWASPTSEMVSLRLYRMSLDTIGRPLTEFKSSREFVTSVMDAMEAHDCAFWDAHILHRDISVGNTITAGGEGLLIDWDLCLKIDNQRVPERTGTWQFMSAALLSNPHLKQAVEDDRESAFYVLLYLGLLYTKHNQLSELGDYMNIFDYTSYATTEPTGGHLKTNFLLKANELKFECGPMTGLIKDLRTTFSVRYGASPSEADRTNYESFKHFSETSPSAAMSYFFLNHPVTQYEASLNKLQERGWLVATMQKYLDEPGWPLVDDAARVNS